MNPREFPAPHLHPTSRAASSVRRLALITTALVGIGGAAFVLAPDFNTYGVAPAHAQNLSEQARQVRAPVGFADVVEQVKPAVISVRVEMNGERRTTLGPANLKAATFRPDCANFSASSACRMGPIRRARRTRRAAAAAAGPMGQGSGFFISR